MERERFDPVTTLQTAVGVAVAVFLVHLAVPALDLGVLFVLAALLGVSFLGARFAFDRIRRKAAPRADPRFVGPAELLDADRHDLVGLRIAIERTAAAPIVEALTEAASGPAEGRAARIARVLLAHRSAWRFAGLDASRPLPHARAAEIFDGWCTDVRGRFGRRSAGRDEPFRWHPLQVVSLHVASPGRIPEVDVRDPGAAEVVLASLRDQSAGWATRVDLWTSERDFTAAELREADPTLCDLSDEDEPASEARFERGVTARRR